MMKNIQIKCAYDKLLKLSECSPNPGNPRTITSEKLEQLKNQLKEIGIFKPAIVDESNVILGGNMRHRALLELEAKGYKIQFPVSIFRGSYKDRKEIVLADNNDSGEWEIEELSEYLGGLEIDYPDMDMSITGFSPDELSTYGNIVNTIDSAIDQDLDIIPEINTKEIITKRGDLWELGNHKLLCGDATLIDDVEKLMGGEEVDCLMTDPPYGVDYASKNAFLNNLDKGNHVQKDIKNDAITNYREWFATFLALIPFTDYNTFYIWMSGKELHNLRLAIEDCKYVCADYLIWVKNNHVLGRKDYNSKHEFCVYGWKNHHKFYGDFSTTLLEYNKPLRNDLHPTMKPVEMISKLICDGSPPRNGIILDLFGGSGTTLIACEKTGRYARLMELDEHYCDVIVERYVELTGNFDVKLNGELYNWKLNSESDYHE